MTAIDYDVLLADLRGRRDSLDEAIAAVERLRVLLPNPGEPLVGPTAIAAPRAQPVPAAAPPKAPPKAPPSAPAKAAQAMKPCARPGCGEEFRPNSVGRPQRFCSKACSKKARQESEERIGATGAINRR